MHAQPYQDTSFSLYPSHASQLPTASQTLQAPLNISWKELPQVRTLKWYEETKTRNQAKSLCYITGGLTGGAAAFTACFWTTTAGAIVTATAGFALPAIALLSGGYYLGRMAINELDPEHRLNERKALKRELKAHAGIPNFNALQIKLEKKILDTCEIQTLLGRDILNMSFPDFLEKHSRQALSSLDMDNKNLLKEKYLEHAKTCDLALKAILATTEAEYFELTEELLSPLFAAKEVKRLAQKKGSYCEFISRNGRNIIADITDPTDRRYLTTLFQEFALEQTAARGAIEAERLFASDFESFGQQVKEETLCMVVFQAWNAQKSAEVDYRLLRQGNRLEHLEKYIFPDAVLANASRAAFLRMPYTDMHIYALDRIILDIPEEELKNQLQQRWHNRKIQDIFQTEAPDFFLSLQNGLFLPAEWTTKVLEDTQELTIQQLLALPKELFYWKILNANTLMPNGLPLSYILEDELKHYSSLESILENFSDLIFKEQLCKNGSPTIARLCTEFISRNGRIYLTGQAQPSINRAIELIEAYNLLPTEQKRGLKQIKNSIAAEKVKLAIQLETMACDHAQMMLNAERAAKVHLSQVKEDLQIDYHTALENKASEYKLTAEEKLQRLEKEYKRTEKKLQQRQLEQNSIRQRLSHLELQMHTTPHLDIAALKREISQQKIEVATSKGMMTNALLQDHKLAALRGSIKELSAEVQKMESNWQLYENHENQKTACKIMQDQQKNSSTEKEALKREIKEYQDARDHTQGLFSAINALSSPLESKQKALLDIELQEQKLMAQEKQLNNSPAPPKVDLGKLNEKKQHLNALRKAKEMTIKQYAEQFNIQAHESKLERLKNDLLAMDQHGATFLQTKSQYTTHLNRHNFLDVEIQHLERTLSAEEWVSAKQAVEEHTRTHLAAKNQLERTRIQLLSKTAILEEQLQRNLSIKAAAHQAACDALRADYDKNIEQNISRFLTAFVDKL